MPGFRIITTEQAGSLDGRPFRALRELLVTSFGVEMPVLDMRDIMDYVLVCQTPEQVQGAADSQPEYKAAIIRSSGAPLGGLSAPDNPDFRQYLEGMIAERYKPAGMPTAVVPQNFEQFVQNCFEKRFNPKKETGRQEDSPSAEP